MMHSTKQRLIDMGLGMLLKQGYNNLGIQALLTGFIHLADVKRERR